MEYLNNIELRGRVGRISTQRVNRKDLYLFSVLVEHTYMNGGTPCTDAQWFAVRTFGDETPAATLLKKGDFVQVDGRIRNFPYTNEYGITRNNWEVIARNVRILES